MPSVATAAGRGEQVSVFQMIRRPADDDTYIVILGWWSSWHGPIVGLLLLLGPALSGYWLRIHDVVARLLQVGQANKLMRLGVSKILYRLSFDVRTLIDDSFN